MSKRTPTLATIILGLGVVLGALATASGTADAQYRGFGLYAGPGGFSFSLGPSYGYHPYYRYRFPPHYTPYSYRYNHYVPRKRYYRKRAYGRCHYKAKKCARNWGWHNHNWRGCMRYYGCR